MNTDWITDAHKEYLSYVLTGTDEASITNAAISAAYHWGLDPGVEDPTDEELSASETATLSIVEVIRQGLEDGSISVNVPYTTVPTPKTDQEIAEAELLDELQGLTSVDA
ncbi:MAG: hypothetical protein E6R04_09000 [Spirochaetes bacterium]|nr:MAG: hypothetical protein E6R04_09000 [Spirochaetota bacterium]